MTYQQILKVVHFVLRNVQRRVPWIKSNMSGEKFLIPFYFFLDTCHNIKYWRALINIFCEISVFLHFCAQKYPIYSTLRKIYDFLRKSK